MFKKIRYLLEALFVLLLFVFFRILPMRVASNIGGYIARKLGPKLKVTRTARINLKIAFPDITESRMNEIIAGMYDNLGRVAGEFVHVGSMSNRKFDKLVEIEGEDLFDRVYNKERPVILFSAHFGNWEMAPKAAYVRGYPLCLIYRHANNPFVNAIINYNRNKYQSDKFTKGISGARKIVRALEAGKDIGVLVDQKLSGGVSIPFFGKEAMTSNAIASFALKYNAIILPAKIVRKNQNKFKVTVYEPLEINKSGDLDKDSYDIMLKVNQIIEGWIRENPEQWFWVHKRWDKSIYK